MQSLLQDIVIGHVFAFMLIFMRLGMALMIMPGIGDSFVSPQVRLHFALGMSFVLTPFLGSNLPPVPKESVDMITLLLSEAFAPGGTPYGRAYNYAEISGDSGVAAMAEFRVGWDPKLKPLTFFQTYVFVDGAKVWNKPTTLGWRTADISSAGAGVRLTFHDRVTLRIEAARPLGPPPWETGSRDWRCFASLWAGF